MRYHLRTESTHRYKCSESIPTDPTLTGIGPFPVLIKTDHICSLKSLYLLSMRSQSTREIVTVEVVVDENYLLNTIGPHLRICIVQQTRRNKCSWEISKSCTITIFPEGKGGVSYRSWPWQPEGSSWLIQD